MEGNGVASCVTDDQFHDSMAFRLRARARASENRGRKGPIGGDGMAEGIYAMGMGLH